jgi:hypothetical protein
MRCLCVWARASRFAIRVVGVMCCWSHAALAHGVPTCCLLFWAYQGDFAVVTGKRHGGSVQ